VFGVGTSAMLPEGEGGMFTMDYDYQDQTRNWHGTAEAPPKDNPDKQIQTHFITADVQYMFNRSWGLEVDVPYWNRYFRTTGGKSGTEIVSADWWALGDIRVQGMYTGFSPDLSTGLTFGLRLPSGDYTHNDPYGDVDRDSEVGSGSLDLLLGGFHRQNLPWDHEKWTVFGQIALDQPMVSRDNYTPGTEVDAAAGIYYTGFKLHNLSINPVAQVIGSERTRDSGSQAAHPIASGYQRMLLSPGLEFDFHPWRVYGDAEFPVYENTRGDQLVAPVLFKVSVSYMF
jgi:hypothetical protein